MNILIRLSLMLCCAAYFTGCAQLEGAASPPNITQAIIPNGKYARKIYRPLRPTYITIHSTDSPSANARAHAAMLTTGSLKGRHNAIGYISWHFTVDDHSTFQSLPTNERGEHADYDGPGNLNSIGIEMCVNRGNNAQQTIARTARLTASLMNTYHIPITNVVPHMHWRQIRHDDHKDLGFKQCPHLLLEHGQLGLKWNAFLAQIKSYQ